MTRRTAADATRGSSAGSDRCARIGHSRGALSRDVQGLLLGVGVLTAVAVLDLLADGREVPLTSALPAPLLSSALAGPLPVALLAAVATGLAGAARPRGRPAAAADLGRPRSPGLLADLERRHGEPLEDDVAMVLLARDGGRPD